MPEVVSPPELLEPSPVVLESPSPVLESSSAAEDDEAVDVEVVDVDPWAPVEPAPGPVVPDVLEVCEPVVPSEVPTTSSPHPMTTMSPSQRRERVGRIELCKAMQSYLRLHL